MDQVAALLDMPLPNIPFSLSSSTLQAGIIIVGVFLLVLLLGYTRHHMLEWSIKGAWIGLFFGMLLTFIGEGVLLVGGRALLIQALHTESIPPQARESIKQYLVEFSQALDTRTTLGVSTSQGTRQSILTDFSQLSELEKEDVVRMICEP